MTVDITPAEGRELVAKLSTYRDFPVHRGALEAISSLADQLEAERGGPYAIIHLLQATVNACEALAYRLAEIIRERDEAKTIVDSLRGEITAYDVTVEKLREQLAAVTAELNSLRARCLLAPYPMPPAQPTPAADPYAYDWSSAPEWARWAATDEDGRTFWYEYRPCTGASAWWPSNFQLTKICASGSHTPDWRGSLRQRPQIANAETNKVQS